uniref:Auxin-responsive protein n=1 Tax=Salix viminalis TaxID=40686 RepID=A0A6N2LKR6_SALVM
MINPLKLVKFAEKWQKLAALERKRISIPGSGGNENTNNNERSPMADQRRFELPISYLSNNIYRELLAMSEEESGLPKNAPVTLLCDAMFMEYAATLMQKNAEKVMEKALLMSIGGSSRCSSFFHYLLQEKGVSK